MLSVAMPQEAFDPAQEVWDLVVSRQPSLSEEGLRTREIGGSVHVVLLHDCRCQRGMTGMRKSASYYYNAGVIALLCGLVWVQAKSLRQLFWRGGGWESRKHTPAA